MSEEARLFFTGVSHHKTPLEVRERLALPKDAQERFYAEVRKATGVQEVVLLSTCNRLEVYGVSVREEDEEQLENYLCELQSFSRQDYAEHRLRLHGRAAIQHLLEVTAGADSQVVGETEIFGQVKEAYAHACGHGGAGPVLNRLFQKSFHAGKRIRNHTSVGQGQVSIGTIAVELAGKIFGGLEACRVLVVGTGEIAERTARAFVGRGAGQLTILSRHQERGDNLAGILGARADVLSSLPVHLRAHDIVIGCTNAPQPVITEAMMQTTLRQRRLRPVFLIDLGVPRNFEPEAGRLDSVFLYDLDDLVEIADTNRAARRAAIAQCRELARDLADRLWKNLAPRLQLERIDRVDPKLTSPEQPSGAGAR